MKRIVKKSTQFTPKESHIELAICYFLRSRNMMFWKQPSRGYFDSKRGVFRRDANPFVGKGVPDIISILDGRFIGFEVKSETGRQTEDQKTFEARTIAAGGLYFVVRSVEEVKEILDLIEAANAEFDA